MRHSTATKLTTTLFCIFMMFLSGGVNSEICKWLDEEGSVHYAEGCPPDIDGEKIEIQDIPFTEDTEVVQPQTPESALPGEPSGEGLQQGIENLSFEPVTNVSQLAGCWERMQPPKDVNPNPNRIEIYPFEEPKYQYFCFESAKKLYTFMTTKKPDYARKEIRKRATIFPSIERYSIPKRGFVLIEHLDAGTKMYWVSSLAKVEDGEEFFGMRTGDLYMTLRNAKTGKDLYFRHLRKIQ